MSLLGTATRRSSKEIPETGAEIGTAEEDVSGDPHPQEHKYDVGKYHVARSDGMRSGVLAMRRRTVIVTVVSTAYTITSATRPQ